jgi:hypothetical protein
LYSIHIPSFVILAQTVFELQKSWSLGGGVTRERPNPKISIATFGRGDPIYHHTNFGQNRIAGSRVTKGAYFFGLGA